MTGIPLLSVNSPPISLPPPFQQIAAASHAEWRDALSNARPNECVIVRTEPASVSGSLPGENRLTVHIVLIADVMRACAIQRNSRLAEALAMRIPLDHRWLLLEARTSGRAGPLAALPISLST